MTEETLGMYALADNPPCPSVKAGDYTICRQADGRIWIQRGDGEGGEFSEAAFAEAVAAFYNEHF